jgi:hypothetical protein
MVKLPKRKIITAQDVVDLANYLQLPEDAKRDVIYELDRMDQKDVTPSIQSRAQAKEGE